MNVAIRRRAMTREAFLAWVENQEGRYEFDGSEPVAMISGTNNHGIISAAHSTCQRSAPRCRSRRSTTAWISGADGIPSLRT